jgi:hypothetical protein
MQDLRLAGIMKKVCLTSRRTYIKVLVIVECVVAVLIAATAFKLWAMQPFHAQYDIIGNFATGADADTAAIRRDWPHRLVQPEWVSRTPDLWVNWIHAEIAVRSVVVGVGWLIVTGLLNHRYTKLSKETPLNPTPTAP